MSDSATLITAQPNTQAVKHSRLSLRREIFRARWAYLFIAPFFVFFLLFSLYPISFSLYLSLTEWKGLGPIKFIGLDNYQRLLGDTVFWQSMLNGVLLFFMYVPAMTLLALVIAVILNSKRVRGFRVFRTIIFMPYITNMVAAGFVFRLLLNSSHGLVNQGLGAFGISPIPWLDSIGGARVSLCLLIVWAWLGYNMMIMLAGFQNIPRGLTEARRTGGANNLKVFSYVSVSFMRTLLNFFLVF